MKNFLIDLCLCGAMFAGGILISFLLGLWFGWMTTWGWGWIIVFLIFGLIFLFGIAQLFASVIVMAITKLRTIVGKILGIAIAGYMAFDSIYGVWSVFPFMPSEHGKQIFLQVLATITFALIYVPFIIAGVSSFVEDE